MHPILARGGRLALYLGLWLLVGGLLAGLLVGQSTLSWWQACVIAMPLTTTYAFVCLSAWYVSRSMPLATTGAARILTTGGIAAILSSAVWLAAARLWMQFVGPRLLWSAAERRAPAIDTLIFALGVLLYLLSLAVSYLLAAFEQSRDAEQRSLRVQVLAREAELRLLRAQIDPHFLFNSLHSISALTIADPQAARRMCVLLADFLRDSLALGSESRIPLERELGLVERFLAVERVRFGDRLSGVIEVEDGARACEVPPLLLQPLVENAVTHGVAHVLEGGVIRISARRSSARLSIAIENPCDRDRPRRPGAGVGLANVRARLAALHGNEAHMDVREEEGRWRVELSMPLTG